MRDGTFCPWALVKLKGGPGGARYWLEPKNWLIVTVVAIGWHADGRAGAGWGLLAALFTAVLPTLFISYGVRRGRWSDRNVGARRPAARWCWPSSSRRSRPG